MALFSLWVGGKEARFIRLEAVRSKNIEHDSWKVRRNETYSHLNEFECGRCALAILGGKGTVETAVPVWGPVLQRDVKVALWITDEPVGYDIPPGIPSVTLGPVRQPERQVWDGKPNLRRLSAVGACCLAGDGCAGVTRGSSCSRNDDSRCWMGDGRRGRCWAPKCDGRGHGGTA